MKCYRNAFGQLSKSAVGQFVQAVNTQISPAYPYLMFIVPVGLLIIALVHQASQ